MNSTVELVRELNALVRLTGVEAEVARSRVPQARDESVRRELQRNASDALQRHDRLVETVRDLGGVPDVVGSTIGRVGAIARSQTVDQMLPVKEALMADLLLEHQLHERARFARVLADDLGHRPVVSLLERIERSHAETIEWIELRLAELGVGGPSAIRPTPTQAAAAMGQQLVALPGRMVVSGVNRSAAVLSDARARVGDRVDRVRHLGDAARTGVSAGREAMLSTSEQEAQRRGESDTARSLQQVRAASGMLREEELPIRGYDCLAATDAQQRISRLDEPGEVRAMIAYETQHKNRKGVLAAAQRRLEEVAAVRLAED